MAQRRHGPPSGHLKTVAVLVLPDVVPFDLVIPDFVFGDPKPNGGLLYYRMTLCGVSPGLVPMVRGIPVGVPHGLEVLGEADTVVVPGRSPADSPLPDGVAEA